ncbi:MAG TPA: hypothetical protein VLX92_14160 [Kofleriaceae bacterium]|nr:hypothetical protein [Kofleriaceae bacterium]
MTLKNISFALVLVLGAAAAGCAAQSKANGGGDDGGGDDGSGSGSGQGSGSGSGSGTTQLDASGNYKLSSTFDLSTNMPGTVGVVVNDFIAATDDPDDPTKWILDQIIAQLPNGTLKTVLSDGEDFVAGYLNDQLLSIAPSFVTDILHVGNDFGQMAKKFGLNSTLAVTKQGTEYSSTHTATGVHFSVDSVETDLDFSDYGLPNIVANNVGITFDGTSKLTIGEHKLPVSYGAVLRLGLDNVIIPLVDPNASDLQTFLTDEVDCSAVGQAISDAIGIGDASTWAGACTDGLKFGASAIYQQIDKIDASALEFDMTGTAKAMDTNNDKKIDSLATGKWTGTLSYSGTPAPLATATFTGTRQ